MGGWGGEKEWVANACHVACFGQKNKIVATTTSEMKKKASRKKNEK